MDKQVRTPFEQGVGERTAGVLREVIGVFVVVGIFYIFLHNWIDAPLSFFRVWTVQGTLADVIKSSWVIFAWGVGLTLLSGIKLAIQREPRAYEPGLVFMKGTWFSILAGVGEEIVYRWLMLFGAMMSLKFLNVITLGLVKWFYVSVWIPLADWASFGLLHSELGGQYGWLFAAAIVSANIRFRKGHEYQGLFGMINSWYIGLILFYLTFTFGLWAAIVVHILYDFCIFWTRSLTSTMQPRHRPLGRIRVRTAGAPASRRR